MHRVVAQLLNKIDGLDTSSRLLLLNPVKDLIHLILFTNQIYLINWYTWASTESDF